MRFGLSDLDELPSLKEFEQLARAALGADEGVATVETEAESQTESRAESVLEPVASGQPGSSPSAGSAEPETILETEDDGSVEPSPKSTSAKLEAEQNRKNPKVESASS